MRKCFSITLMLMLMVVTREGWALPFKALPKETRFCTAQELHGLWRQRQVHKVYEAVAPWRADLALPATVSHRLEEPEGEGFMQMQVLPGEPNAHMRVELLRLLEPPPAVPSDGAQERPVEAPLAVYRLQPLTGRRHQLRAQMNALGLPITGDRIYPVLWPEPAADAAPDWRNPLQLLAREIAFTDPLTGQARRFHSALRLPSCTLP